MNRSLRTRRLPSRPGANLLVTLRRSGSELYRKPSEDATPCLTGSSVTSGKEGSPCWLGQVARASQQSPVS